MYGNGLERGPEGQIGVGLGMGSSKGSTSLIVPNLLVKETGMFVLSHLPLFRNFGCVSFVCAAGRQRGFFTASFSLRNWLPIQ